MRSGESGGDEEIKKAYKSLALQYHPDEIKNKEVNEEKFRNITGIRGFIKQRFALGNTIIMWIWK